MEFHATNIKYMNDPQEVKYFDTLIEEISLTDSKFKTIFDSITGIDYGILYQTLPYCPKYIISLCQDDDSLPMWKYYARGNGYNIGLDIDILKENINEINGGGFNIDIFDIIYNKQEQIEILKKFIDDNFDIYRNLYTYNKCKDGHSKISKFIWELSMMRYQFKHEAYKDEKEVRILLEWNEEQEFNMAKKNGNATIEDRWGYKVSDKGVIVEYLNVKIPEDCVKSIMCSPLAEEIHIEGVNDYIAKSALNMHEKRIRFYTVNHFSQMPISNIKINKSKIPFRDI